MNPWWTPAVWTDWTLAHRRAALLALAVPTVLALAGLLRIESEVGYRAFLGADHPVVEEFDSFVERFGGGLPLLAVWSCASSAACESALDEDSLRMAAIVAAELEGSAAVVRVDSPATSGLLVPRAIGFPTMRRLVEDGEPVAEIESLRGWATTDPVWQRRLVSEDGSAGALVVWLRDSASGTAVEAYQRLRAATARFERKGFRFSYVGGPVEFVVAGAELQSNTQRIIPLMVGVIAVALVILFAAPASALASLSCVGLAVLWTMGAMGWSGWPDNSLTQILPPLVLVVGVCDAVHLLGRYVELGDSGADPADALRSAALDVGPPCALTTLTTVVGFGSLAVSDLESISRFGVLAAAGVVLALVASFTALPLLVATLPRRWFEAWSVAVPWSRILSGLAETAGRGRRPVLAIALVLASVGVAGFRQLQIDATFEDLYGADSEVVVWAQRTAEVLRAPDTLEISLDPPAAEIDGAALTVLDRVQREVSAIDGLGNSLSLVDVLRRLNRWLHRDELPLQAEADERGRPMSVYRLLRSRDPTVTDTLVSPSMALRISLESGKLPQEKLRAVLAQVDAAIANHLPNDWSFVVTGPLAVVGRMIDAIRTTQLRSFALAGVAIFALLLVYFRSLTLAALAMVPTLLPVIVTLGAMGAAGIALDIGTAMVASVILGLAVDDAIHWVSAYVDARSGGLPSAPAAAAAHRRCGRAIVTTSLALAVGFTTLSLSAWNSIASFGVIAAIAVVTALLAAVLVLPALAAGSE